LLRTDPHGPAARFVMGGQPSLEAQIVNLADELAYSAHDLDDGVRSGLLDADRIADVPLVARCREAALREHPQLVRAPGRRLLFDTLRRLLARLVGDLVETSEANLIAHRPEDADAVRAAPREIVRVGADTRAELDELRRFLFAGLYRHPRVARATAQGRMVVAELFAAYLQEPREMPAQHADLEDRHRAVADYVAGMTDRYALREHHRLTGRREFDD